MLDIEWQLFPAVKCVCGESCMHLSMDNICRREMMDVVLGLFLSTLSRLSWAKQAQETKDDPVINSPVRYQRPYTGLTINMAYWKE